MTSFSHEKDFNIRIHIGLLIAVLSLSGCAIVEVGVTNPVPEMTRIAVVPFFNLSQESTVDGRRFALAYFSELQKVPGYQVVPVGITETAMQTHQLQMSDPRDALRLAEILQVDAVVVGAVTDYDPYYPPRIGLQVSWYSPYEWCFQPGAPIEIDGKRQFIDSYKLWRKSDRQARKQQCETADVADLPPQTVMRAQSPDSDGKIARSKPRPAHEFILNIPLPEETVLDDWQSAAKPQSTEAAPVPAAEVPVAEPVVPVAENTSEEESTPPFTLQLQASQPSSAESSAQGPSEFWTNYRNWEITSLQNAAGQETKAVAQSPIIQTAGEIELPVPLPNDAAATAAPVPLVVETKKPAPAKEPEVLPRKIVPVLPGAPQTADETEELLPRPNVAAQLIPFLEQPARPMIADTSPKPTPSTAPPQVDLGKPQSQPLKVLPQDSLAIGLGPSCRPDAIRPVMSYTRMFDGADQNLVAALRDYVELSGDKRSGGWEAYLHRSEDFIRFTAYRMILEMLQLHGGESRRRFVVKTRQYR